MVKAIILDRDGTINIEKDYLYKIEDFEFEKGAKKGLKILASLGYLLVVVTNQSGIARGYYKEEDLLILNGYIKDILLKDGVDIKAFYYCPHHLEKGIGKYKVDCNCRKPKTGMLDSAVKDFNIDRDKSFMIGDNISDVKAGLNAKITPILVKTGHGLEHIKEAENLGVKTFETLYDFAMYLKKKEKNNDF